MSLVIGDNFSFQGAKPLDGRLKYDTVAAMKAVADATMYDGCLAYCSATDKTYQWKSTNSVDSTLGRWREFSSGGGGGAGSDTTAYHTSDTEETTLSDSDKFPFYDSSASAARHSTWSNLKAKLKSYFDTVYDLNKNDISMYGTSSTGASTTAKTASVSRGTFTLVAGAKVSIKFTNTNTASAPTLNVGSTGAKNIKYIDSNGTVTTPTTWWGAGDVVTFIYDGTQWIMQPTVALAQPNVTYGFTPVGTVISVMGTSAPTNYLKCDGTVYNISSYPELANYFYAQFGSKNKFGGNGTTTFAVPDLRGEFLRGTGTNSHTNQGSGENVGTHQDATEIPYIDSNATQLRSPGVNVKNHERGQLISTTGAQFKYATGTIYDYAYQSYTSRPTNTSVLYCIAVKDIYMNPADTYSTNEQVVGKWIDGSYLYQKTISGTFPATTDGVYNANAIGTITGIKKVVAINGWYYTGSTYVTIPWTSGAGYISKCTVEMSGTTGTVTLSTNNSGTGGITCYVTLQYTK